MTNRWTKGLSTLAFAMILICMIGCEDSDNDSTSDATVNITGTWVATTSVGERSSLSATQTGNDITGTFFSSSGSVGTLSGTVSGSTVRLTLQETNYNHVTTEVVGTVDGNTMNGTVTQSDGGSASYNATKQ